MLGSSSADIRLKGEFTYQSKMPYYFTTFLE
jgi:hypothetical protein